VASLARPEPEECPCGSVPAPGPAHLVDPGKGRRAPLKARKLSSPLPEAERVTDHEGAPGLQLCAGPGFLQPDVLAGAFATSAGPTGTGRSSSGSISLATGGRQQGCARSTIRSGYGSLSSSRAGPGLALEPAPEGRQLHPGDRADGNEEQRYPADQGAASSPKASPTRVRAVPSTTVTGARGEPDSPRLVHSQSAGTLSIASADHRFALIAVDLVGEGAAGARERMAREPERPSGSTWSRPSRAASGPWRRGRASARRGGLAPRVDPLVPCGSLRKSRPRTGAAARSPRCRRGRPCAARTAVTSATGLRSSTGSRSACSASIWASASAAG